MGDIWPSAAGKITIGRLGENERMRVHLPIANLLEEIGEASFTLLNRSPGETTAYPIPTAERDGEYVIWTVTSRDTQTEGTGECQLVATVNGVIAKTMIWTTEITRSLDGSGEVPDVWESWQEVFTGIKAGAEAAAETAQISASESLERANAALQYSLNASQSANNAAGSVGEARRYAVEAEHTARDVQHSAEDAAFYASLAANSNREAQTASDNARSAATAAAESAAQITGLTAAADTLPEGSAATAQYDAETGVLTLGIPKGETGAAGPKGDPGEDYVLTAEDKAEIAGMVNVPVTDVQIDGSSVVQDGVADIPTGSTSAYGVYRSATVAVIKAGTALDRVPTVGRQNSSVFYGLASAAGDTSQSASENAVGTYTDEAKVAIQKMLGIYASPWELIREDTVTNDTEADIVINADSNGQAFELTDVRLVLVSPQQDAAFAKADYGRVRMYYQTGAYDFVFIGAYTQAANASAKVSYIAFEQSDGMLVKSVMPNTSRGGMGPLQTYATEDGEGHFVLTDTPRVYNKINITKVTGSLHYILYGKRKVV